MKMHFLAGKAFKPAAIMDWDREWDCDWGWTRFTVCQQQHPIPAHPAGQRCLWHFYAKACDICKWIAAIRRRSRRSRSRSSSRSRSRSRSQLQLPLWNRLQFQIAAPCSDLTTSLQHSRTSGAGAEVTKCCHSCTYTLSSQTWTRPNPDWASLAYARVSGTHTHTRTHGSLGHKRRNRARDGDGDGVGAGAGIGTGTGRGTGPGTQPVATKCVPFQHFLLGCIKSHKKKRRKKKLKAQVRLLVNDR